MQKTKSYKAFFDSRTVKQAWEQLLQTAGEKQTSVPGTLVVENAGATWDFDNVEEFFAAYRRDIDYADFDHHLQKGLTGGKFYQFVLRFNPNRSSTIVSIRAQSRPEIEAIFNTFENALPDSLLSTSDPPVEKPVIFIGHGRSGVWRDLKDH